MRYIDDRFINDLLGGKLSYFFEQVKNNRDTLSLEVREGYINIYYRGGSLLKIEQRKNRYAFKFDAKYCKNKKNTENYDQLSELDKYDILAFKNNFSLMMCEMDTWFDEHPKEERDYQHKLLVNNPGIVDIEYQIKNKMRLDMLYFADGTLYIVENKFGNGAIGGKSGMSEHYKDICELLNSSNIREEMIDSVCHITKAKKALGLTDNLIEKNDIKNIEILFLMANYIPKGKVLINELDKMDGTVTTNLLMTTSDQDKISLTQIESLSLLKDRLEYLRK